MVLPGPTSTQQTRARQTHRQLMDDLGTQARTVFHGAHTVVEEKVRPGDTFSKLLKRQGITTKEAFRLARLAEPVYDISRKLRSGKQMVLAFDQGNRLVALKYPMKRNRVFWMVPNQDGGFTPYFETRDYEPHINTASTVIKHSLFADGAKAGLSDDLLNEVLDLFKFDINFARDLRSGDRLTVVYEQMMLDGKRMEDGEIVAAEFINRGRPVRIFRYTNPKGETGYFKEGGQGVGKILMRAPLKYTRISSMFSNRRRHPIYGYIRPHKGIDFAAPKGTPIKAAGDGRVVYRGFQRGFGNLIVVKHDRKYATAYAHMNRFQSGLRVGQRVNQGDLIGYVGSTGAATGPHLHYEVRVYGKQVDPLSMKLPVGQSIPQRWRADFRTQTAPMLAQLDNHAPTGMAASASDESTTVSR